jgi:hypothetical protein
MKIYLSEIGMEKKERIIEMLEDMAAFDCNFGDTNYTIHLSDFDCCYLDECSEDLGTNVLWKIMNIIEEAHEIL